MNPGDGFRNYIITAHAKKRQLGDPSNQNISSVHGLLFTFPDSDQCILMNRPILRSLSIMYV